MYIEEIDHPIDRQWCSYCQAEATSYLPIEFKGTGTGDRFRIEANLPVCRRCFRDFTPPRLTWDDVDLPTELVTPEDFPA